MFLELFPVDPTLRKIEEGLQAKANRRGARAVDEDLFPDSERLDQWVIVLVDGRADLQDTELRWRYGRLREIEVADLGKADLLEEDEVTEDLERVDRDDSTGELADRVSLVHEGNWSFVNQVGHTGLEHRIRLVHDDVAHADADVNLSACGDDSTQLVRLDFVLRDDHDPFIRLLGLDDGKAKLRGLD